MMPFLLCGDPALKSYRIKLYEHERFLPLTYVAKETGAQRAASGMATCEQMGFNKNERADCF